ncbi:type IV secretion system DNA-binding domain-containing protein [Bradyrhizobium sp. 61]|uniref:TraM recognition domain-containing protein n=1 Tax=Bradyrhizobium sp. 61 TaxID=2782679 RepID=UPI001FF82F99|nr:TraM recognition domain-containing protein [Bradyrhizobium sp. 61]MCK1280100.1 type IV secretion system DNA-binding domain-containing protein [Bradyrhizobium sp. 61]
MKISVESHRSDSLATGSVTFEETGVEYDYVSDEPLPLLMNYVTSIRNNVEHYLQPNATDVQRKGCLERIATAGWMLLQSLLGTVSLDQELLEVGRSLGLRVMIGLQSLQQLSRIQGQHAPAELLQLIGTLICFRLNPGTDAKRICEERLTTAPVRTWTQNDKTGTKEPSSKEIRILTQDDLSSLRITRDGAQGYLVIGNAAFGLEWPFPNTPIQRESSIRSAWIRSN